MGGNGVRQGLAYCIFGCKASSGPNDPKAVVAKLKPALDRLPEFPEETNTPKDMRFEVWHLSDALPALRTDGEGEELFTMVAALEAQGASYVIRGALPKARNVEVAYEMAIAFLDVCATSGIFESGAAAIQVSDVIFMDDKGAGYVSLRKIDPDAFELRTREPVSSEFKYP